MLILISMVLLALTSLASAGETLYNGIVLPGQWPPKFDELTREPRPVLYLKNPPAVIPIDVGRQFFVDDFLIEKTGPENDECGEFNIQKRNDILLGFSRDGFHWDRPHRERFISCTWDEKIWRYGNVQSVAGGCLIVGDKLYFYFSGHAKPRDGDEWDKDAATGLAVLRRDGFASMDAGEKTETLTTRLVTFQGKHLFVNVDCPEGELKAEVLDEDGKVIKPFALKNCEPVSSDKTLVQVNWQQNKALSALAGKPVRFRFHLKNSSLYAFWVSPDKSGASHGYVGAGGPGFTGPTDTIGQSAVQTSR